MRIFFSRKESSAVAISDNCVSENAPIEKKYEGLKKLAKEIYSQLNAQKVKVCGSNKSFEDVESTYQSAYKAAYGYRNDIMKRVSDYNASQQAGAAAVKAGVVVAATLGAAFTGGGTLAVAGVAAGTTVAAEVSDKATTGKALDVLREKGLAEYLKTVGDDVDWKTLMKEAVISGGCVLIGGKVAEGVSFVSKGMHPAKQAIAMFGADVAVDATLTKLTTGEIRVGDLVFSVLLSGAGNIVAMRKGGLGSSTNEKPVSPKPNEPFAFKKTVMASKVKQKVQEIRNKFAENYPDIEPKDVENAIQLVCNVPNATADDIKNVLDKLNDKNIKHIEPLLQHIKGKNLQYINGFLDLVNDENHKIAETLLKSPKINNAATISDILIFANPGIEDALEKLLPHPKIDAKTISKFAMKLDATGLKNVHSLLERNLETDQMIILAQKSHEKINKILELCDKGHDFNFAVKAVETNINFTELNTISDTLGQISNKQKRLNTVVAEFARKNPNINLTELNNYIKSIDLNKLFAIAPNMKNFSQDQLFSFFAYHFKNGTKAFNTETLTLPQDLTTYLRKNYVNADKMEELLSVFPLTSRNVGEMPNGWLDGIQPNKQKETIENVYTAISNFQTSRDVNQLSSELSSILNKPVTVQYIAEGHNGIAYKISVHGSKPVCLKLFKGQERVSEQDLPSYTKKYIEIRRKTQGSLIEPQVGLFVTANAPDQYARMYFGRVCDTNTESTGFCVSEFIDGEAGRNNAWFDIRSNGYRITALDAHAGNHINGKVIDYGGILVTDAQGKNLTIDDN